MLAVVNEKYGPPDVFQIKQVAKPIPGENEVLIKTFASSINSWDWDYLNGKPRLYRLLFGLLKPKHKILGADVAGVVEAVGKGVTLFTTGDEVYGDLSYGNWGGFAEYTVANEKSLAKKPLSISFEQAAAVPQAAVLALQGLRLDSKIQPGQKILINGAGGGVGTFAIQLAKLWGAEVTAIDQSNKLDLLKSLGTDYLIDYKETDFTKTNEKYDLILDSVANKPPAAYKRVLKTSGALVVVGGTVSTLLKVAFRSLIVKDKQIKLLAHQISRDDLIFLGSLLEEGKLKTIVDKVFELKDTLTAFRHYQSGKFVGKIVIRNPK